MKFCWTTIMVKNMKDSIAFYQNIIGLDVNSRMNAGPGVEIVFLGDGETKVELICNPSVKDISFGKDISLGFEVDSLDAKIDSVKKAGVEIHSGPFQPNPHVRFFYILDPGGLKIQFVEHM
jgi:lactoylglutathione lyase